LLRRIKYFAASSVGSCSVGLGVRNCYRVMLLRLFKPSRWRGFKWSSVKAFSCGSL